MFKRLFELRPQLPTLPRGGFQNKTQETLLLMDRLNVEQVPRLLVKAG